jgi:hypothetical protein
MDYITRADALQILRNMRRFETGLKSFFASFDYDLHENLGRRNILLSNAQEKETQKVLSKRYKSVISDGAPGKPDVIIEDINVELECKLTSGSRSNGTLTYNLQTDWETICNKEQLDYNYIIANEDFSEFCYILFEGLTPADFHPPSSGSRGKARMRKETAYMKATFLVGSMTNNADVHISNINQEILQRQTAKEERLKSLNERLENIQNKESKKYEKTLSIISNETKRFDKAIEKLIDRRNYWNNNSSYTFNLEPLKEKNASIVNISGKIYNVLKQKVFNEEKFFNTKDKRKVV